MNSKKKTNYCIRFGHSLWSAISCKVVDLLLWNNVPRTLRAFPPKLQHFLSFKCIEI